MSVMDGVEHFAMLKKKLHTSKSCTAQFFNHKRENMGFGYESMKSRKTQPAKEWT